MLKHSLHAPAFHLAPVTRKKVNKIRLCVDVAGLWFIYTFGSLFPPSVMWLVSIYSFLAWMTILTLDPTRLPDASTTRIHQQKAWSYFGRCVPLHAFVFGSLLFVLKIPVSIPAFSIGRLMSLMVYGGMLELFYRNVLQAKLRQLGFPVIFAILFQSAFFAVHFYLGQHSFFIAAGTLLLGMINGFFVYKTRSIYPNFLITILWMYLFS